MAILNEITVGSVVYYLVDSEPIHVAPRGSVAIVNNVNFYRIYVNNDGGSVWLKTITKEFGEIFFSNNTTERAEDTQNTWVGINNIATTTGEMKGFVNSSNSLVYSGEKTIRCLTTLTNTLRGSTRSKSFEMGPNRNLLISRFNSCFIDGQTFRKISTSFMVDVANGTSFLPTLRWLSTVSGGGPGGERSYVLRNMNLNSIKIDEADTIFLENWESNSFSTNNWVLANASINVWVLGTAENFTPSGTRAVYISNNGGTSASYTITTANISHIYRDFIIPNVSGDVLIVFAWKSWGENAAGITQYDYGTVVITDTNITPIAGTEVTTALATLVDGRPTGNGRIGATTNSGKFNLAYGGANNNWKVETINLSNYKGQTKRIVFTWVNDASVGNQPPFVIDDIKIEAFL
jgi:hypothetical protein